MAWNTPSTWVAGAVLTATQLNQQLRDNMKAIGDPWTTYAPTWTTSGSSPNIGNGSFDARYCAAGKRVDFYIILTFGSTTTGGTGQWRITLPVTPRLTRIKFEGEALDVGVSARPVAAVWDSAAGSYLTINTQSDTAQTAITATAPFTWGTSDRLYVAGTYEAA